ncbi:MAG TPA: hypothetical protein VGO47_05795 [Chlamydiales bacterium]|nr:hypothetical protein [Chlamydiales bacterium]
MSIKNTEGLASVLQRSYPQTRNNLSNTDNDTVTDTVNLKNSKTVTITVQEVHHIARTLTGTLNSPENFAMYCGYAWHIPQNILWMHLDMVKDAKAKGKARNPAALFTALCKPYLS